MSDVPPPPPLSAVPVPAPTAAVEAPRRRSGRAPAARTIWSPQPPVEWESLTKRKRTSGNRGGRKKVAREKNAAAYVPIASAFAASSTSGTHEPAPLTVWAKLKGRVSGELSKIRYVDQLIQSYEGSAWSGFAGAQNAGRKIKPRDELRKAQLRRLEARARIRSEIIAAEGLNAHHVSLVAAGVGAATVGGEGYALDDIFCASCRGKDSEMADNDILLCDGPCQRAYHAQCLTPPLDAAQLASVLQGDEDEDWFCPQCDAILACLDAVNDHEFGPRLLYQSDSDSDSDGVSDGDGDARSHGAGEDGGSSSARRSSARSKTAGDAALALRLLQAELEGAEGGALRLSAAAAAPAAPRVSREEADAANAHRYRVAADVYRGVGEELAASRAAEERAAKERGQSEARRKDRRQKAREKQERKRERKRRRADAAAEADAARAAGGDARAEDEGDGTSSHSSSSSSSAENEGEEVPSKRPPRRAAALAAARATARATATAARPTPALAGEAASSTEPPGSGGILALHFATADGGEVQGEGQGEEESDFDESAAQAEAGSTSSSDTDASESESTSSSSDSSGSKGSGAARRGGRRSERPRVDYVALNAKLEAGAAAAAEGEDDALFAMRLQEAEVEEADLDWEEASGGAPGADDDDDDYGDDDDADDDDDDDDDDDAGVESETEGWRGGREDTEVVAEEGAAEEGEEEGERK